MERYKFIDIAKGLGIFFVVCSHVYPSLIEWASPFVISIFFVTSGFCLTKPINLKNKSKKLLFPYFLFSVVLLIRYRHFDILDILGVFYSRFCLYPLDGGENVYFLQSGNGPLWFLTALFMAYLVLKGIQDNKYKLLMFIFYILITYIFCYLPYLLPWSIDTCFLFATLIYSGTLIRKYDVLERFTPIKVFFLILVYLLLIMLFDEPINLSVRKFGDSFLLFIIAAILGCVLLMKLSIYIEGLVIGNIISEIGKNSLTIFSIHMPFIPLIKYILGVFPIEFTPPVEGLLVVLLIVFITYPISVFCNKYIFNRIS